MVATAAMMRCLNYWRSFGRGGLPGWWINSETCAEQPLHSCYRVGFRKLQDTESLLLWSRHFATRSPLAAAARNTFSRQLQTNFESFPNNCCISRDCRLTDYFIINMCKFYLLFELPCIYSSSVNDGMVGPTDRACYSSVTPSYCWDSILMWANFAFSHTFLFLIIDAVIWHFITLNEPRDFLGRVFSLALLSRIYHEIVNSCIQGRYCCSHLKNFHGRHI
jgi:hypothetical protein